MTRRDMVSNAFSLVASDSVSVWQFDQQPINITFAPGITIDGKTGNVTIPEGLSLDDASRAFWDAVVLVFPALKAGCGQ